MGNQDTDMDQARDAGHDMPHRPGALNRIDSATDRLYDWSQTKSGKKWRWYIGSAALLVSTTAALLAIVPKNTSVPPESATVSQDTQTEILRLLADGKLTPDQATQLALAMTGQAFPETPTTQLTSLEQESPEIRYKESVEALATSDDITRRSALALIQNSATRAAGFTALESIAETPGDWRQIGELAFPWDVAVSTQAYGQSIELGSDRLWDYVTLSRLIQKSGDLAAAKTAIEAGIPFAKTDRDATAYLDELGKIYAEQGDFSAARKAFEQGLTVRQRLSKEEPSNPEYQRDISISFNKIGDIARAEGDLAAAKTAFESALDIRKQLVEAYPSTKQFQSDLAVSYNKVGDAAKDQGDLPSAQKAFEAGLKITQRLAKLTPENPEAQNELSVSYGRVGDIAHAQNKLEDARKAFQSGLEISERLALSDPSNLNYQRSLYISLMKTGDITVAQDDFAVARGLYEKGLIIAKKLAASDSSNIEYQRDLSACHFRMTQLGGPEAKDHMRESHRLLKDLKDTGRLQPSDARLFKILESIILKMDASDEPQQ